MQDESTMVAEPAADVAKSMAAEEQEKEAMEERAERERSKQSGAAEERAARVDLSEFAEALSSGVLKALERQRISGVDKDRGIFWPWIWAGWIMGPDGPTGPAVFGPFGPEGPPGGGGPQRPG
jgi:hypothetical protein